MRRLRACLGAAAAVTLAAAGTTALAASSASGATSALGDRWYAAAPYLMPLDNDPPDPAAIMDATGLRAFQLAFILAPNGGGCTPTWGGTASVSSDTAVQSVIDTIRAKGGDVSVSIGGYGGTKLGQTCTDAAATAAAYQQVITKYGLHAIDFDLEEPEYENSAAIKNEIGAAKILQQNNPGLYVSVTTPGTADGTGWFGKQMLLEAKSQGFTPNNFSIMPFDGGFNGAASQTSALTKFNSILQSTFGWDQATAYAHEGFSGMNGRSDTGEYFTQADFQTVLDYATSHHMDRFTFWSLNRDRQCTPADNGGRTSGTCSSVPQDSWDFARYSVTFAGVTPPPTTPPPTPTPTPAPTSCKTSWNSTTVYTAGDEVSYAKHNWKAKWWTRNEVPGASEWGPWQDEGTC
ncbi:chitinase [Streptomyces pluripotens]|uniref:Chitinase n=1 Tax=Streptomyces pluripotens TaxID=1355015 RepID=A0A221NSN9_9ACTN|nr:MULTISPECIES: carbohydrate-binding protein [Streptomyces]ARP68699.1 chitinase [Streptomyces pluripotens]ASN22954.1 chitinase [Streptomyces pluripotens]MCH0559203.1 chitinase [Streptomyces sp. MUM 16J]